MGPKCADASHAGFRLPNGPARARCLDLPCAVTLPFESSGSGTQWVSAETKRARRSPSSCGHQCEALEIPLPWRPTEDRRGIYAR